MERNFAYFIILELIIGILFGIAFGAAINNTLLGAAIGATSGVFIGWFSVSLSAVKNHMIEIQLARVLENASSISDRFLILVIVIQFCESFSKCV